jgi:hypothetical protein
MESLMVQAASPESAGALLAALSRFHPSCGADGCQVVISLNGDKDELLAALGALEEYVTTRATGPTRLELDGHQYVMEAANVG